MSWVSDDKTVILNSTADEQRYQEEQELKMWYAAQYPLTTTEAHLSTNSSTNSQLAYKCTIHGHFSALQTYSLVSPFRGRSFHSNIGTTPVSGTRELAVDRDGNGFIYRGSWTPLPSNLSNDETNLKEDLEVLKRVLQSELENAVKKYRATRKIPSRLIVVDEWEHAVKMNHIDGSIFYVEEYGSFYIVIGDQLKTLQYTILEKPDMEDDLVKIAHKLKAITF